MSEDVLIFKSRVCKRCRKIYKRKKKNSKICEKCYIPRGSPGLKKQSRPLRLIIKDRDIESLKKECPKCKYLYSKHLERCPKCEYHEEIWNK